MRWRSCGGILSGGERRRERNNQGGDGEAGGHDGEVLDHGSVRPVGALAGREHQRPGRRGQHREATAPPLNLPRWAGPNACRQTVKNTTVSTPPAMPIAAA